MDTPNTPNSAPNDPPESIEANAKVLAWLELKREMQSLHAQIEYVRLLLRLGVGQQP